MEHASRGGLTIIPSVMNRTRAAVMWIAKKEHGAPRQFFLRQQLNRSSCPEGGTERAGPNQPLLPALCSPSQDSPGTGCLTPSSPLPSRHL